MDQDAAADRRANEAAERRGAEWAEVRAQLNSHERRLDAINGSIGRTATEIAGLRADIGKVVTQFETATAIARARADDLKRATENQVGTRTFVLSLAFVILTLAGLILGVGLKP